MIAARNSLIVLLALAPLRASAQSSQADAEFKRGKALMTAGKLAEACEAFDKSQALEANISTLLNQANCREKNNQLATARRLFTTAAAQTDRASDPKTVQLHNVALDRAAKLGPRVSTVTLEVPPDARVAGLSIKRGVEVVEPLAWGTALQLDGGTYTFEVSAPDHTPWSQTVTVANEKDKRTVKVPVLAAIAKPIDTKPVDPVDTKPVDTKPVDTKPVDTKPVDTKPVDTKPVDTIPIDTPKPRSKILPYAVGGGGIALVAAGVAVGFWARSTYDDAKDEGNDEEQKKLWSKANNRLYLAQGMGIAGIGCIGVAAILLVRGGSHTDTDRAQLQPSVTSGQASLVLSGRF